MDDLISRKAAIDVVENYPHGDWNMQTMKEMVSAIDSLPSAQPEIIRCQYCKYACIDPERESDEIYCSENDFYRWDDWFCGSAERREDE